MDSSVEGTHIGMNPLQNGHTTDYNGIAMQFLAIKRVLFWAATHIYIYIYM